MPHPTNQSDSRSRKRERGNLLAAVYISLIPVIGIISAFFLRSTTEIQMHQARKAEAKATLRVLAAIEVARNEIMNSTYTSTNNDKIKAALLQNTSSSLRPDPHGNGYLAFDSANGQLARFTSVSQLTAKQHAFRHFRTIDMVDDANNEADDGDDKVSIYIANVTGLWYAVEAKATVRGTTRSARLLVRERDPFSRFGIFINSHYQGIGGTPKGDIHTNRTLQIYYPNSTFDDFVSARDGFQYMLGASSANTVFNGGSAAPTAAIAMPSSTDVTNLKNFASGAYYIGSTYKDAQITFSGSTVTIKATLISTNAVVTLLNAGALPAGGVIYSEGNIKVLQGDVNGRVTVGCGSSSGVKISGNIRYVDAQGDVAMINPTTPSNYIHNPAYDGNSAVGIISNGPVIYGSTVPSTLELHAAVFSRAGNAGLPGITFTTDGAYCTGYDATFQKTNLDVLGCTIADKRWVGTVVNSAGTVLSGFQDGSIEYDRELLNNPPPHFLEIDRPLFKGVEILENLIDI